MGYERYPRGTNPQGDYYNRSEVQDYGQDYGSGRFGSYSSARDYEAAGEIGPRGQGRFGGWRERDDQRFGGRNERSDYGQGGYGQPGNYGARDTGPYQADRGQSERFAGSYGSDGRRFENWHDRADSSDRDRPARDRGDYGRQPRGYDYQDRGFIQRAGDEVRSWFGDDEADRRRREDERRDQYNQGRDYGRDHDDYHSWRRSQIDALDRDYDEYRQENRQRFNSEFGSWRTERQGQRGLLGQVAEHQEVVGSDGAHVGTVDKVRGDRILLTKNDKDAGGEHHSIPSRWLQSVDGKVTLRKTAAEAKDHWREEQNTQALFGDKTDRSGQAGQNDQKSDASTSLNRSFSGTY